MPLPNPDYLANQNFNWDESQFPAVLITTAAGITASKRHIRWDVLDSFDRQTVHDLIMGYNNRVASPPLESAALTSFAAGTGYHTMDFNGTVVGANLSGLVIGETYNFSVVLNGTETFYSIAGADGQTFTTLAAALNVALPASMNALIFEGNLEIETVATGVGNVIEIFDDSLFRSCIGFVKSGEPRVGVTLIADVFDLNFRDGYQSYTELLIGKLRVITNKAPRSAKDTTDVYFNHGTGTWLLVYTDVAPV